MINDEVFEKSDAARSTDAYGVTLVSFHGVEKPAEFRKLIDLVSHKLNQEVGDLFQQYPIAQVHATIIGLEGRLESQALINDNMGKRYEEKTDSIPAVDVKGFLDFFRFSSWPILFQIGGFHKLDFNPYDFQRSPWGRTFDIRADGLVVMMGWPCFSNAQPFAPELLGIRKYFERFGIVHKYHIEPIDQDNDLFFVVGSLNYEKWKQLRNKEDKGNILGVLERARTDIRESLSSHPHTIEMTPEDIWVVKYRRTTLGEIEFAKRVLDISKDELQSLYR
jgi:hypothetical protein